MKTSSFLAIMVLILGMCFFVYIGQQESDRANKAEQALESCQANNHACAVDLDKCVHALALGYAALQSSEKEKTEISKGFKWASSPNSCDICKLKKGVLKKGLVAPVTSCQIGEEKAHRMRCP
jgi:hypothetical protein